MALARDLVELESQLRGRVDVDLFSPTERSGLLGIPECALMLAGIAAFRPGDPAAVMRLCLQALRIQNDEMRPKLLDAEFVATLPPDTPGIARPTERVVHEMLSRATKEIILLGYEFTELDLLHLLASAVSRGAK